MVTINADELRRILNRVSNDSPIYIVGEYGENYPI